MTTKAELFKLIEKGRKKPSKYRAVKTVVDGIKFDSKKEATRYGELKLLEKACGIVDLEIQKRFDFEINGVKLGFYKADFVYWIENPKPVTMKPSDLVMQVVEDCKGFKTPVYRLKKKLMLALHGIEILET